MQSCDVVIVGGGPAGSSCAWRLHRLGCHAVLLDKCSFPRDKPCAGWITPQVVAALELDVTDYAKGRTWQPITAMRCGTIGGPSTVASFGRVVSYGIRRCEFDEYLVRRSGAELLLGEAVASLRRDGQYWIVNDRFRTRVLVGAGGHFCPVARLLGARAVPGSTVVFAREAEFPVDNATEFQDAAHGEIPELYFCRDLAGYGWCFRKQQFMNIGLGRAVADQLTDHVHAFIRRLASEKGVSAELPGRLRGHAYQLYENVEPVLARENVVLVGDAAGLAYPYSGEGIRPAVESGLLAADSIHQVLSAKGSIRLECYAQRLIAHRGPPRRRATAPSTNRWLMPLAARLLATRWFARNIVLRRWFLHQTDPIRVD